MPSWALPLRSTPRSEASSASREWRSRTQSDPVLPICFCTAKGLRVPALHRAAREADLRPALRGEGGRCPFAASASAHRDEPRGQHDRLGDHLPRGPCLSSGPAESANPLQLLQSSGEFCSCSIRTETCGPARRTACFPERGALEPRQGLLKPPPNYQKQKGVLGSREDEGSCIQRFAQRFTAPYPCISSALHRFPKRGMRG